MTFNDDGSGPLHLGPANCSFTFVVTDGSGPVKGYCAFGDADGDRIFTDFTGNVPCGSRRNEHDRRWNRKVRWNHRERTIRKCKGSGKNGELQCAQRLDYRLP